MQRRESQSPFALLGLLRFGPMSGYDIKQVADRTVNHFWREGWGQIYPTLKKLEAEGLVTRTTSKGNGRPDRHVYALTDEGRQRLQAWLETPPLSAQPRNELLLKTFFAREMPLSVLSEHIERYRSEQEALLREYDAIAARIEQEAARDPEMPFWRMTLSYGRHQRAAAMAWCDETLEELKAMGAPAGEKGKHRESEHRDSLRPGVSKAAGE
jgi:PadR family transcriptional regulator AphA